jgi:hypothetical protein
MVEAAADILIPVPNTVLEEAEISVFLRHNPIKASTQQEYELLLSAVKKAKELKENIEAIFQPGIDKLNSSLDCHVYNKDVLLERLDGFEKSARAELKKFLEEQEKKNAEARKASLLAAINGEEYVSEEDIQTDGAGLRNKPWNVRVDSFDVLWNAIVESIKTGDTDKYKWTLTPDLKALKAMARAKGELFNIPGCTAFREKTINIK